MLKATGSPAGAASSADDAEQEDGEQPAPVGAEQKGDAAHAASAWRRPSTARKRSSSTAASRIRPRNSCTQNSPTCSSSRPLVITVDQQSAEHRADHRHGAAAQAACRRAPAPRNAGSSQSYADLARHRRQRRTVAGRQHQRRQSRRARPTARGRRSSTRPTRTPDSSAARALAPDGQHLPPERRQAVEQRQQQRRTPSATNSRPRDEAQHAQLARADELGRQRVEGHRRGSGRSSRRR